MIICIFVGQSEAYSKLQFKLVSSYKPSGDQPQAIDQLTKGYLSSVPEQVLLGVTGSGKTFTIANVIQNIQKPTLVLAHNKTLAAQLYQEFKSFFPENAVEYFVSYYDYYQPEAYVPSSDLYIEKDLSINKEIEKLRLRATSSLLSGRKDVIVIASVSCLYGIGNPAEFEKNCLDLEVGQNITKQKMLTSLVNALYTRSMKNFERGQFRVRGETIDVFPAYSDEVVRVHLWQNTIEKIELIHPVEGLAFESLTEIRVFPSNIFVTSQEVVNNAIKEIQDELFKRLNYFEKEMKMLEHKRLKEKTELDLEMMKELGFCSGIENYSRYFDRREEGSRPFCLMDYFPDDSLLVIDESHVTLPQVKAMYGGDRSRKMNLVEYGFRLPSALDNRPLTFDEFSTIQKKTIYVSATPGDYELAKTEGTVIEQVIRPTGLIDPGITILPIENQVDKLIEEIYENTKSGARTLVTTLTKRMAEELSKYMQKLGIKCKYIHSDIDTLERIEIIMQLRKGLFDVLIGVNLLREGLDLPEVSLVAIMDADKEGFLRSYKSLIQTIGRAARNVNGRVLLFANKVTDSMQKAIDETIRRRLIQVAYNEKNNITPMQIQKNFQTDLLNYKVIDNTEIDEIMVAEDKEKYNSKKPSKSQLKERMKTAIEKKDFLLAAKYRDQLLKLEKIEQ